MTNFWKGEQNTLSQTVEGCVSFFSSFFCSGAIFKYAQAVPKQLLSANLESNSVRVRSFLLSLENLVSFSLSDFKSCRFHS